MNNDSIRILKIASCPTLSQSSTVTYHIGCSPEGDVFFRIWATSGGGTFSKEWISLKAVQQHLKKQSTDITSIVLYPLFRGKSVNTPSFLLAVMKEEGLVQTMKGKHRNHELRDPAVFMGSITELIESGVDLDPETKPQKRPIRQQTSRPKPKTSPSRKTSPTKSRRSR